MNKYLYGNRAVMPANASGRNGYCNIWSELAPDHVISFFFFSLLWSNYTTHLLSAITAANWLECTVDNCMSGKGIVLKKAWTQSNASVFMCYFLTLSSRLPSDRSCWRSKYGIIHFEWHPMYSYDGTVVQNIIWDLCWRDTEYMWRF